MDEYIVVDAEIRVVAVLVLACDLHDPAIGKERDRLPEALGAPDGLFLLRAWPVFLSRPPTADPRSHHRVPERLVHPLGVRRTKARMRTTLELVASGGEQFRIRFGRQAEQGAPHFEGQVARVRPGLEQCAGGGGVISVGQGIGLFTAIALQAACDDGRHDVLLHELLLHNNQGAVWAHWMK